MATVRHVGWSFNGAHGELEVVVNMFTIASYFVTILPMCTR
jgi:hypothetical protein